MLGNVAWTARSLLTANAARSVHGPWLSVLERYSSAGCYLNRPCLNCRGGIVSSGRSLFVNCIDTCDRQTRLLVTQESPQSKLLVVHPNQKSNALLQEALRLAESYTGTTCRHIGVGPSKQLHITPSTYFGPGVVKTIQEACTAQGPSKIFVNAALTPVQQRNLQAAVGMPVLDRVGLIIDIFAQRAQTREARLQVELAALDYRASRLVRALDSKTGERKGFGEGGTTEVVSARERGRSGSTSGGLGGAGGGGQSELQLQRQRLIARRKALQKKLSEVQRTREVQRASRKRAGKPVLAVVGYTNAGKSSLMQALTRTDAGVQDRLFATLDPALRRVHLPSGREAILSDTVGFISDLPHQLVNAFRATLEEVCEADLLLHVLDASSPNVTQQREAVLQVLRELGISEARLQNGLVEVWNKTDLVPPQFAGPVLSSRHLRISNPAHQQANVSSDRIKADTQPSTAAYSSSDNAMQQASAASSIVSIDKIVEQHPNAAAASSTSSANSQADGIRQKLDEQLSAQAEAKQEPTESSSSNRHPHPLEWPQQTPAPSVQLADSPQHQLPTSSANDLVQAKQSFDHDRDQSPWHSGAGDQQHDGSQGLAQQHNGGKGLAQQHNGGQGLAQQQVSAEAGASAPAAAVGPGKPLAMLTSAVTGAGLPELLVELEKKISLKWATRDLADSTARLGPRLLTHTVVGPPNKQRRPRWRGSGEWESALTHSVRDQSTKSTNHQAVKSLTTHFLRSYQQ